MKLVRYGPAGKEKPGLIDAEGKLRDDGLHDAGREIAFNGRIEGVHGNILDVKDCYLPR